MSAEKWDAQFRPFAMELAALQRKITDWLTPMTREEIVKVMDDGMRRTSTNCWWAIYEVVPIVQELCQQELTRRRMAAEAVSGG